MITHVKEKIKAPRLTLGVDLDGTSGDFHSSFRQVLMEHQGYTDTQIPQRVPKVYSYIDAGCFPDFKTFTAALHAATHQRVYYLMKPYEGFRKHLTALYESDVEVKIITSRPDDALDDTIGWLEEVAKVPYHSVTITHEKVKVPACAYLDDMPGHIEAFRAAGHRGIVFDQPYNREIPGERVRSWKEIGELLGR